MVGYDDDDGNGDGGEAALAAKWHRGEASERRGAAAAAAVVGKSMWDEVPIDEEGRRLMVVNMPALRSSSSSPTGYRLLREVLIVVLLSMPPTLHGLDLGESSLYTRRRIFLSSPPIVRVSVCVKLGIILCGVSHFVFVLGSGAYWPCMLRKSAWMTAMKMVGNDFGLMKWRLVEMGMGWPDHFENMTCNLDMYINTGLIDRILYSIFVSFLELAVEKKC